jgi:Fur family transcriptional regulator, ferric uptake regulator
MKDTPARRRTRQRDVIVEALRSDGGFRSAQALHADIVETGGHVGLTTVYRALQALSDEGRVDVLHTPEGEARYRMCAQEDHHHHLVCRECGVSVEVKADEIETWVDRTAHDHGFRVLGHTAEVYGLCPSCLG